MNQKITGYHKDAENHWVAELECGHGQHVRHDPPWMVREWVMTEDGRRSRLGNELNCVRCDEAATAIAETLIPEFKRTVLQEFENAGVSGLCAEGRIEAALGAIDSLPLRDIFDRALKASRPSSRG